MNSILSITLASLALATAARLPNGTQPRAWIDVCDYQDPFGHKCCEPAMEGHQYLVVPENIEWSDHAVECG